MAELAAVVFDLDDTLFDHSGSAARGCAVLYVRDDHELDVVGARAAGLRAVHLDRRGAGPAGAGDRIASPHELTAHLA